MRIDILTLFPEMFIGVLGSSILKRAAQPRPAADEVIDQTTPNETPASPDAGVSNLLGRGPDRRGDATLPRAPVRACDLIA